MTWLRWRFRTWTSLACQRMMCQVVLLRGLPITSQGLQVLLVWRKTSSNLVYVVHNIETAQAGLQPNRTHLKEFRFWCLWSLISISVDAEDNRGGQAAEFNIAIRYCYCLNGGACPDFSSLQQGYGEGEAFALVECRCTPGWSGKECIIQDVMELS